MELNALSKKPELVKIVIDDEETINDYKEAVEFYMYDRSPIEVYLKLSQAQVGGDTDTAVAIIKTLVLTKEGKPVMTRDTVLPARVLAKAIAKVMEQLGN